MSFKVELTNSADVEMFSYDFTLGSGVVLAQWNRRGGEWVTWRVYPSQRFPGKLEAEVGHYFGNDKTKAYNDFKERTGYAS